MNLSDNEHIEQLLADPIFRLWVTQPNESLDAYWLEWRQSYPGREESFWLAKETLGELMAESLPISRERAGMNINRILTATAQEKQPSVWSARWLSAAASVLLLTAAGFYIWMAPSNRMNLADQQTAPAVQQAGWVTYANAKKFPTAVTLPDGSTVIVFPKSSIHYPALFTDSVRNVQLSGEAFFEVTKDAAHPFIVSSAHMSTRVTGTSFRIRDTQNILPSVRVKTGRVEVSFTEPGADLSGRRSDALVLKAHQQVTFPQNADHLPPVVAIANMDDVSVLPIEINTYTYRRTAVPQVLLALQQTYGIPIHFDKKKLEHCSLTATLGDQPFLEKVRMICLGLNLHFQVNTDHSVTITGNGCG